MNERISTLISKTLPLPASHYKSSQRTVHQQKIHIAKKHYPRFYAFGNELSKEGIYSRDYAYGITEKLAPWVKRKNWEYLPMNIYLGDWAVSLYKAEIGNRQYQTETAEESLWGKLVNDELFVAKFHIVSGGTMTVAEVVDTFQETLTDSYLKLFHASRNGKLVVEVLDILTEQTGFYGINYKDYYGVL